MLDMGEQDTCQLVGEDVATEEARRHCGVNRVRAEVHALLLNSGLNRNLVVNILLSSVLNSNIAHSEGDFLIHDHPLGAHSSVHDVQFSQHSDSADTLRIKLTSHLETIRGGHIGVGGDNTENNSARVRHVSAAHIFGNCFDVLLLVGASQRDTCYTGKINESQVGAGVGEYLKDDGLVDNSFGLTTDLVGETFDGLTHLFEVSKFLSRNFLREDSPGLLVIMQMSESHFERTARHNTTSSGQEIDSHN